jgi:hypothetical protein
MCLINEYNELVNIRGKKLSMNMQPFMLLSFATLRPLLKQKNLQVIRIIFFTLLLLISFLTKKLVIYSCSLS